MNDWENHTKMLVVDTPGGKIRDIFNYFLLNMLNFYKNIFLKIIHIPKFTLCVSIFLSILSDFKLYSYYRNTLALL